MGIVTASHPRHAVALYRVATAEQGHSGLGLEAQQASVRVFVAAQGWTLIGEFSDIASGKDDRRPGYQAALARCRQLGAVLVAARLDRITRRAHALSRLLEDGISIRAVDLPGLLRVGDDAVGGLQETDDGFFRDDRLSRFRAMKEGGRRLTGTCRRARSSPRGGDRSRSIRP